MEQLEAKETWKGMKFWNTQIASVSPYNSVAKSPADERRDHHTFTLLMNSLVQLITDGKTT